MSGRCALEDSCSKVRCENGGTCRHVARGGHGDTVRGGDVYCDCSTATGGYTGATCRTSNTWRSCRQFLEFTQSRWASCISCIQYMKGIWGTKAGNSNNIVHCSSGEALIDLDGPGPVPAALLSCEMEAGAVVTVVPHSSMEPTKVSTQIFLHRLANIFSAGGRVPGSGLVQPEDPLRGGRGGGQAAGGDRGQLQPAAEVRLPTVPPAGQHLR